ncbi:MAG: ATP-binding protein [Desulfocapsaceae bacterium]|nr:ATP-binding protein [Desulfocapsaceae bacterium]
MKIVHKINLANISVIILIALTGFFAFQNINLVLTKLRFTEIADDLNTSFLEMRLSEKNFFLYGDTSALSEIGSKIDESMTTLESVGPDIIKAIGRENLGELKACLGRYRIEVETLKGKGAQGVEMQAGLRETGQQLREFSDRISRLERIKVNSIISRSKRQLFSSLCFILITAIGLRYMTFFNILRSLKQIKNVVASISQGDFRAIETEIPRDELGTVMTAINAMSMELENREEQIIQSKKLASLGILTAGVAHELGNPLNNISMIAQTYMEVYENLSKEDRIDFMVKIEEETQRIKHIVDNLLDFSRPKKSRNTVADLNGVVLRSFKLVQNMIHVCNVEARLDLAEDLPAVLIDEGQIVEVLINLMTNSLQASSPGARLTVTTSCLPENEFLRITLEDTGKGIPQELLDHVFDPFFTTKGNSGTGLGLFVSYGIVKNHQGTLKVSSKEGVGTCFTIELPVYNPNIKEEA